MKYKITLLLCAVLLIVSSLGCSGKQNKKSSDPIQEESAVGETAKKEEKETISPANSREEVFELMCKAFSEHDFDYIKAAYIEPYAQKYIDFLLNEGSEEDYWSQYDEAQGSYYNVGIFESYSIEITKETKIEDTKAVENLLRNEYDYECTVEEAYDVDYTKNIHGTLGTHSESEYRAQVVSIDGHWYISKDY